MNDFVEILNSPKMYKHLFFDMDNTLTPSRSPIGKDMKRVLVELCKKKDVIIVSGGEEQRMWKQMTDFFKGKISFLAQNGNAAYSHEKNRYVWQRTLLPNEKKEILDHIHKIEIRYADIINKFKKEENLIEYRGCQISFSFVGHNASLADKLLFDPKGQTRLKILEETPLISKTVNVKLGGTTCFDYNQIGKNKGYNIREWMKYFDWLPEDSLYVGDALFQGGNDDTVFGVCDTLQVNGPEQTFVAIQKLL